MTKKMFVSIVAIGAIIAGSANAAELSEASCRKSSKYVWVSGATSADGGRGVCIKKNPCDDNDYAQFCDKRFKDIQVCTSDVATKLVRRAWNCNKAYKLDVDNKIGQDYVACEKFVGDGMQYRVFEFDDTNETFDSVCARGGFDGACIAVGGDILEADDSHNCRLDDNGVVVLRADGGIFSRGGASAVETADFFRAIQKMKNW